MKNKVIGEITLLVSPYWNSNVSKKSVKYWRKVVRETAENKEVFFVLVPSTIPVFGKSHHKLSQKTAKKEKEIIDFISSEIPKKRRLIISKNDFSELTPFIKSNNLIFEEYIIIKAFGHHPKKHFETFETELLTTLNQKQAILNILKKTNPIFNKSKMTMKEKKQFGILINYICDALNNKQLTWNQLRLFAKKCIGINDLKTRIQTKKFETKYSIPKKKLVEKTIPQKTNIGRKRTAKEKDLKNLKIGVLGNFFEGISKNANYVECLLMTNGNNIVKTLSEKGYDASFFDMTKSPDAMQEIIDEKIDIMFNVCLRINNSRLLQSHAAALLDILKIPYTGSNPYTLALCQNKIRTKELLAYHNIPTPKWDYAFSPKDPIRNDLKYPLIVKPANAEASEGITNDSVVQDEKELTKQLEEVTVNIERPALIEEYIEGDEYHVGFIGNQKDLQVLPLSRQIFDDLPKGHWHIWTFDTKWHFGNAYQKIRLEEPANIPNKLA